MTDNIVTSADVTSAKKEEKTATKKAPAKKAAAPKKAVEKTDGIKDDHVLIIFESGASFVSGEYRFTRADNKKELPYAEAQALLELDNFRLADQLEIEDYLNSKED